ncbi:MAG: hypothetical protein VYA95_00940 [Candidatus Thermoplasmatota archaeon]|nr:hypothetical protein [Candidatus Thermoplasmatota archaeon]
MAWGIPEDLDFTPKQILRYNEGYIAIGVDGDLQKISSDGKLVGIPIKPFPTQIRDAVIIDDTLIATWLDQELLLARMAALDLKNDFSEGVNRGDLRVRRTIDKSLHPAGNDWSHVLDAEPISLNANSDSFSFVLWKKGVYNLAVNSVENWRSAEPKWPKLAKIPRAMETIATTCDDEIYEIWSKGGGVIRYDVKTGEKINQEVLPLDGFLNQVYKCGEHYLLLFNNSNIALYENGNVLLNAKLSGPINYAEWSETEQGWHIAGWRELVFISTEKQNRIQLKELAVFIDSQNGLYLCNDGKWDIIDGTEEQ